jgi:3-isopropylmalate dehydrogenase
MNIAVLPGDGIGPEIVAEAVKVLKALQLPLTMESAPVGGAAYDVAGHPLPPATLDLAKAADAILFGAVGDWKYDTSKQFWDYANTWLFLLTSDPPFVIKNSLQHRA